MQPRKERNVVRRFAIALMTAAMLVAVAVPAVAAQRAVLAELFGATW